MKRSCLTRWITENRDESKIGDIIWNALGSGTLAVQSAVLLIFVAAKYNLTVSGEVTIGYAIANLFMTGASYGIRNFQVTDQQEQNSFSDYFFGRLFTVGSALFIAVLFILSKSAFGSYATEKAVVVMEIILLKLIDAFCDVFLGRYQQIGHFRSAAKIMTCQQIFVTGTMCILIGRGFSVIATFGIAILLSALIVMILVHSSFPFLNGKTRLKLRINAVASLLKKCTPLFVGSSLSIYVGNIPKYAIDTFLGEEKQAIFGYLMLPVFVVTLMNQFIYQPFVKDLGDLWIEKKYGLFKRRILSQCGIVIALSLVILAVGCTIGLPILSWLYHVELNLYRTDFVVLLLGGSLYSLAYYLSVPITVMRQQKYIAVGYIAAMIFSLGLQKLFIMRFDMIGAAWLYVFANLILTTGYSYILLMHINGGETR